MIFHYYYFTMKSKAVRYRKTMNTLAKVGGIASKAALGAAIYTNPAIAGTVLAAYGTKAALGYGQKYADKYFQGKTGKGARLYRSTRDIANAGLDYAKGDYAGAAMESARLVGDTGFLSRQAQRKYTSVTNNYVMPTLKVAGAAQSTYKASGAIKTKTN
jgi:hypothetical protein